MSFKINLLLIMTLFNFEAFAGGEGGGVLPNALVLNPNDMEHIKLLDSLSILSKEEVHEISFVTDNEKEFIFEDLNKKQYIILKSAKDGLLADSYKIVIEDQKTNIKLSN